MLLWCDDDDCDDIDCDDDGGDGDLSMILDEITVKSPKTIKFILHLLLWHNQMIHTGVGCVKANLQTSSRQITELSLKCSFKRQL